MKAASLPVAVTARSRKNAGGTEYAVIQLSAESEGPGYAWVQVHADGASAEVADSLAKAINGHEAFVAQLRQDYYELTTLSPRLSPAYRKNVDAVRENIAKALALIGERP